MEGEDELWSEEVLFEDSAIDASTSAPSPGEHACAAPAPSGHVGDGGSAGDAYMEAQALVGELHYFGVNTGKFLGRLQELQAVSSSMRSMGIDLGSADAIGNLVSIAESSGLARGSVMDLTGNDPHGAAWNFSREDHRQAARDMICQNGPILIGLRPQYYTGWGLGQSNGTPHFREGAV